MTQCKQSFTWETSHACDYPDNDTDTVTWQYLAIRNAAKHQCAAYRLRDTITGQPRPGTHCWSRAALNLSFRS